MKYLSQFLVILAFSLAGEALQRIVPLPIPASVYGLVLLFSALCLGVVKLGQVKEAGGFLSSLLPLLFVSPAAGVLNSWGLIKDSLIPMLALVLVSTVLTFGITGRVTQFLQGKAGRTVAELLNIDIFPVVLTVAAFQIGRLIQKKWPIALFNPTLIGMILVVAFLSLSPMEVETYQAGAGKLSWLMTPATICLAIPMYEQFRVLRKNLGAIVLGVAAGAFCCILGIWVSGRLLGFEKAVTVSLMPKSVTTAIGVPLSELFGGLGGVTTAAIIVTGISANMLGPQLCKLFGITDEIARGAAFGTAGHVIGTAKANELGELTGAVSSLSLVTAGILTAVVFPLLA